MTVKHLDAVLKDYNGPIFTTTIELLRYFSLITGVNTRELLKEVAGRVGNFIGFTDCITSDGYSWYACLKFGLEGGEVVIAFPWLKDLSDSTYGADGDPSDRSIAVYTSGNANLVHIDSIIAHLVLHMIALIKERSVEIYVGPLAI